MNATLTDAIEMPLIHSYTRAQALEDGVLIDATEAAKPLGFRYPVALTAAVRLELTPGDGEERRGQSFEGRLHDLLHCTRVAARRAGREADRVHVRIAIARQTRTTTLSIVAAVSAGDNGEPVVTLMLPDES